MIGRLTKGTETAHEKGDGDRSGSDVGALDDQLKSHPVGTQYDVLATTGVDEDMLEARQGGHKNTGIVSGWELNRLGHGRER